MNYRFKMASRVLVIGAFVCAAGLQAAELSIGKSEVSGFVGLFSGLGEGGFTKANMGASAAVRVGSRAQLFGEFGYVPLDSASTSGSYGGYSYSASASSKMYNGVAGVRIYFPVAPRVAPYFVVAGGASRQGVSGSGSGAGVTVTASASQWGGLYGFGGGASCYLGSNWGVRPELRYQRLQYSGGGGNSIALTVGVFRQFGK